MPIKLQVSALTTDSAAQAERIAELEAASTSLKEVVSELEAVKDKSDKSLQDARLETSSLKRQLDASEEALTSLTSEVCAQMPRESEQMKNCWLTVACSS